MEIWGDIQDYEGLYQVSSLGNVRSIPRTVMGANGHSQTHKGRLLKPGILCTTYTKYYRVTLSKENRTQRFSIHRLVAEHFIPNPENKPFVNHLDNNAENNAVANLEWCTHAENMLHAQKQGRLFESQSKGGSIGGAVHSQRRKAKIESLKGTCIGDWLVLNQEHTTKGKKAYVLCRCRCGTEEAVEFTRLMRKEVTNCRACGQRRRSR